MTGIPGKQLWGQFSALTPAVKAAAVAIGAAVLVTATVAIQWGTADSMMELGPESWIDAPLHGDVIPLAPYSMVAHASTIEGLDHFEFSVDGVVEQELESEAWVLAGNQSQGKYSGGYTLYWVGFEWTPPGPGIYDLEVRALHLEGLWGEPALAQVTVIDPSASVITVPEVTPATAPTTTTVPATTTTTVPATTTTSTTTTSTTTTQPGDSAGPGLSRVDGAPAVFYQGTAGCGPTEVTFTALATDPSGIGVVSVFYRVVLPGVEPDEFQTEPMGPIGSDAYQATIESADLTEIPIPGRGLPPTGTLEFYVVATDTLGNPSQSATDTSIIMQVCTS